MENSGDQRLRVRRKYFCGQGHFDFEEQVMKQMIIFSFAIFTDIKVNAMNTLVANPGDRFSTTVANLVMELTFERNVYMRR